MTSNPTLHIHPNPPIDINDLTDAMTIIAAGIGWPLIKHTIARIKPDQNIDLLVTLITEGATGVEYNTACEFPLDKMNARFINKRVDVYMILDDLPRSVWNRVCDLLHDGRPDAALRVIQAHHNVVQSLSNDPTPEWTNSVPPERVKQRPTAQPPTLVLQSTTEPRDGYTYAKIDGLYYGPLPVNYFVPPMEHLNRHDPHFS